MTGPLNTFAQISPTELGSLLTIMGGMLGGFYVILKVIIKQSADDRKADRDERKALVAAINTMAQSTDKVAKATRQAAREAKERNGHLADISVENKKQVLKAISGLTIDKQTVHNQFVENEQVNHKEEIKDGRQ